MCTLQEGVPGGQFAEIFKADLTPRLSHTEKYRVQNVHIGDIVPHQSFSNGGFNQLPATVAVFFGSQYYI